MTSPSYPGQPGVSQAPGTFPPAPAPARPPRKRRTWLIVLVTVAVLLLAVCGFGAIRLFLNIKHVVDIEKEINTVTAAFIDDTRDGLSAAGYDGLCAEAKEQFTQQNINDLIQGKKPVTGYRVISTNVDYAQRQAMVDVEVKRADGATAQETYIVAEEAGRWKMCGFPS